jgi:hypothetical protein
MANYPAEIELSSDEEERLKSFLDTELLNHYMEKQPFDEDLKRWQTDYWAKPNTARQTFPFDGAANLIIPLTAICVEAIHARNMTTMFALPQFVSCKTINPDWDDSAHPVESALDHVMLQDVGIRRKLDSVLLEIEKFGSGIAKAGYERVVKTAVRTDYNGREQEFDVVIKDGPCVDPVSMGRFLMPYSDLDPQMAYWLGEEHAATPYQIKQYEESGFFRSGTIAVLRQYVARSAIGTYGVERRFQRQQEELEHRPAQWPKFIDWCEIWMGWNIESKEPVTASYMGASTSGKEKEIVVHYHRASRHIMSCRYNWNKDLHRNYRIGVYQPVEHRWAGIGICKQNEQFQKEITTQHRQRIDNATLANMRMFKINKLSGYGKGEPIFPGKIWFLDDMDHLDTIQMGEIYPSAYNNEQATLQYSQQRTGVNDTILGAPQVGTPGTATSDLARIQEGNKKFDYYYENIKEFVSGITLDVACNWAQFGPKTPLLYTNMEDGDKVLRFFSQPADLIRNQLLLQIRAAGQQQNKILDRQNWQAAAAILGQYYTQLIQLAQLLQNPQLLQEIGGHAIAGATEAIQQIMESYDIRNINRIIPLDLLRLAKNGAATQNNGAQGSPALPPGSPPAGGPAGGPPGLTPPPGLPSGPVPPAQSPPAIGAAVGAGGIPGQGF